MDPVNLLLQKLLANNPQVTNNPRYQEMLKAVQNNDSKKGEEIANNLCESYGMTKEQALAQAKQFFGFK